MPVAQISNPSAAQNYTALQTNLSYQTAAFQAASDIPAKTVVQINSTGTISVAPTGGVAALAIGVTLRAISSGQVGSVIVSGIAEGVTAQGAIAAGDIVKRSATTAGAVATTATPGVGEGFGVAIAASVGGVVSVWVSD